MTKQERLDWDELYNYVKKHIMNYSDDMKLPKHMILRLQGLHTGNFCANKKLKPMANYSFKVILYTFQLYKNQILNIFKTNDLKFKDENHKINYCMRIIEDNINDLVIKMKLAEKVKEKKDIIDNSHIFNDGADYKNKIKNEQKTNNLNDLWVTQDKKNETDDE